MELQIAAEKYRTDGTINPILKGVPAVFTRMIETGAPNLYEDESFVLYLNKSLPYPDMDDNSGMAFVHLLACPKERIYNAATLRSSDMCLLEHMRDSVENLVNIPEFREKVILKIQEKMPYINDRFSKDVQKFMFYTDGFDMEFYFHIHPYHSVGHLHMHCITGNIRTNTVYDYKNVPLKVILEK
jgi:hypothetical protein